MVFIKMIDKIKEFIFRKKCPNTKCSNCKYYYTHGKTFQRRCKLVEKIFGYKN